MDLINFHQQKKIVFFDFPVKERKQEEKNIFRNIFKFLSFMDNDFIKQ